MGGNVEQFDKSGCDNCDSEWRLKLQVSLKRGAEQLGNAQAAAAATHIQTLSLQGALISSITSNLNKSAILSWTKVIEGLLSHLFKFARKALQQQLPTAANRARWKRTTDAACSLCQAIQTNKHVLSHCSSPVVLDRYKKRHDDVLSILANWVKGALKDEGRLYVDLSEGGYRPLGDILESLRPDLA